MALVIYIFSSSTDTNDGYRKHWKTNNVVKLRKQIRNKEIRKANKNIYNSNC